MSTLRENNFGFISTVASILKNFNNNSNIEIENFKVNDYCDTITVNVYFKNSDTARSDFFDFFKGIDYTMTENYGLKDEDYYNEEDYPNGATVIPDYVKLWFTEGVDEVCYSYESFEVKAN